MLLRPIFTAALLWPAVLWAAPGDPAEPKAEVPPFIYQSAFVSYQSLRDEPQTPDRIWREANDTVGRIGGHAGYLRGGKEKEALQAPVTPAARMHHAH